MTENVVEPGAPPARASSGGQEEVLYEGRPAAVSGLGSLLVVILTVGLGWIYFWLRSLGTRYRITTERVVIESGILSKRLEHVDLYRIDDYIAERPFGQRLLGTGNLIVRSADKTTPSLVIRGIRTDVVALYEKLRAATEADKRRRGVRVLDTSA